MFSSLIRPIVKVCAQLPLTGQFMEYFIWIPIVLYDMCIILMEGPAFILIYSLLLKRARVIQMYLTPDLHWDLTHGGVDDRYCFKGPIFLFF